MPPRDGSGIADRVNDSIGETRMLFFDIAVPTLINAIIIGFLLILLGGRF